MTKKSNIRWAVFLIPWILVIATIILNLADGTAFNALIMTVTTFILEDFDWLFALMAFICVVLIVAAYFSPFGNVRIGGSKAKPILNQSNYIWIVLCTIMAAGILLWACAEPMYHYYAPPASIEPQSPAAITFLMKDIFLEWTVTPMCIYGMPAILFAFLYYNANKKYSIGSMLFPALSDRLADKLSPAIDCICLFALVCGMAASMGSRIFMNCNLNPTFVGLHINRKLFFIYLFLLIIFAVKFFHVWTLPVFFCTLLTVRIKEHTRSFCYTTTISMIFVRTIRIFTFSCHLRSSLIKR